ncbi:alpha/beta hydrolase [Chitinophaga rhizophila]|uniref:Alpha/beta hydrolase n=1 Tax=Chitinophaga rhizophila TaxID=2866212 RepID=A0ABS7GJ96_9BACT|nr:alpha/beta hydrolase-fold protein [Chitinophaga rhizophila]MBW8687776.1 alpha/beta hydrolase [Chitinophaga rhizophila]
MVRFPVLLLSFLFLLLGAQAQTTTAFPLGVTHTLSSTVLNEKRIVNIYLPEGYTPAAPRTYPVIYLLDGGATEDFIHIAGLTQFLTISRIMPPSIVVGIANVDRKRDFTYPTRIMSDRQKYPTTGGSARFISFLEKELQPFIRQQYKVNDSTTLIGQSLGGLLATEILLKQPGLFSNYVIVSPSLWWDAESLLTEAADLLAKAPAKETHIFIAVGEEGDMMKDVASSLAAALQETGKKHLFTHFSFLPKENHLTILHNAVYRALQHFNKQ